MLGKLGEWLFGKEEPKRQSKSEPIQVREGKATPVSRGWETSSGSELFKPAGPTLFQQAAAPLQQSPTRQFKQAPTNLVANAYAETVAGEERDKARQETNRTAAQDYNAQLGSSAWAPAVTTNVREMDWGEYQALTPRQRAAVDVNTELVAAINADKAEAGSATADGNYSKMVERLFGEGGGSDTVAPRTVALLSELNGNKPQSAPQDLDQYLGLNALVGEDDLRFLTDEGVAETKKAGLGFGPATRTEDGRTLTNAKSMDLGPSTKGDEEHEPEAKAGESMALSADRYAPGNVNARAENAVRFAEAGQLRLAQTLSAGQGLIGKLQNKDDLGRKLFGEPTMPIGFNPDQERDQGLQSIFDTMALRDLEVDDAEVQQALGSFSQEFGLSNEQLVQFFETKLKTAEYGNTPIGMNPENKYLNPDEFRSRYYTGGS